MYLPEASSGPPPEIFGLVSEPVRWSLLLELAYSDRRVAELCELVGRPQNLVSYHLAKLRAGGIVASRASAADKRDSYYAVDLERCRTLLATGGQALHPGIRLRDGDRPEVQQSRPALSGVRVLFLCTGNSARSQIAEALARTWSGAALEAFSAGSRPKPLHPNAIRVMRAAGIDIAGQPSKHFDELSHVRFDCVVTLCDRVREVCPEFPGVADRIHWSIPDPAQSGDGDEETYPAFERAASEIARRTRFLLDLLEHTRSNQEVA